MGGRPDVHDSIRRALPVGPRSLASNRFDIGPLELQAGCGGNSTGLDGGLEGLVVALVLVGVGYGEVGDGLVEGVAVSM
jgi:hypothetical protein